MFNDNNNDFESFLHNPMGCYKDNEKAATLCFIRRSRFVEGYNINTHLEKVLRTFFGNRRNIQKTGLTYQYNLLKQFVIDNNLIGLIRYGADYSNTVSNSTITKYTTVKNDTIDLTIGGICYNLLREYFGLFTDEGEKTLDSLYEKTPNFSIYFIDGKLAVEQ